MSVSSQSNQANPCKCHDNSCLIIERTHLSRIVAGALLLSLFVFVAGFFWGKHRAFEDIASKLGQDSFADQLYYAMSNVYNAKNNYENKPTEPRVLDDQDNQESPPTLVPEQPEKIEEQSSNNNDSTIQYQALLFGGTAKATHQLSDRLKKHGIQTIVKERISTTAKGKKMVWYQLVSSPYNNKEELNTIVKRIQQHERLNDIRIVQV